MPTTRAGLEAEIKRLELIQSQLEDKQINKQINFYKSILKGLK